MKNNMRLMCVGLTAAFVFILAADAAVQRPLLVLVADLY